MKGVCVFRLLGGMFGMDVDCDDVILSWSWSKTFPFLEISNYGSLAIFGKSWPDFKFFNVSVWNVKWDLFEHEWSISNHFPPPNPTVDFAIDFCDW